MDKELRRRSRQALTDRDLGEEVEEGLHIKDLGSVTRHPNRDKGEVEQAAPVSRLKRKNLKEREALVGELSARLMDDFIHSLNDPLKVNPIRDGIPACVKHPFPPGCIHACKEGVLPRVRDHTLGDVFTWVKALIRHNYKGLLERRPELRGYNSGKL